MYRMDKQGPMYSTGNYIQSLLINRNRKEYAVQQKLTQHCELTTKLFLKNQTLKILQAGIKQGNVLPSPSAPHISHPLCLAATLGLSSILVILKVQKLCELLACFPPKGSVLIWWFFNLSFSFVAFQSFVIWLYFLKSSSLWWEFLGFTLFPKNDFIYLFFSCVGSYLLRGPFSSCGHRGLHSSPSAKASLVVEHGL